jgi:hypothetical protein
MTGNAPGPYSHPDRVVSIDPAECYVLLRGRTLGRIAIKIAEDLVILPVYYAVMEDDIVFRTAPGTKLDAVLEFAVSEEELFGLFGLSPPRAVRQPESVAARPPTTATEMPGLSGAAFEAWVAEGLSRAGFQVKRTPPSRDGGIDVVATRTDALGLEARLLVQCKGGKEPAGLAAVRELRGAAPDRVAGATPILACCAGFTADARAFAAANGILLWDEAELAQLSAPAET